MIQAVSARPEGEACDTGHGSANRKQVSSLWMLAADEALRTLGYLKPGARDRGLVLYVDTAGVLYAVANNDPPPNAVLVCSLKPGMDVVTVAARLRHTVSRWRLDSIKPHEDND
jgi:hypothetical protein